MVNHDKPSLLLPAILAWCTLSCKPLQHGGLNPKEPPGSTKTQLCKATIPEPSLLPQVARSNFSCIQEMARQLRGAGKAAKKQNSFKHFFFSAELGCFGLNFESIQQSSVPSRIRPIFSKAVCFASISWSVYTERKKGKSCTGVKCKERLLPKYVVGFCRGEAVYWFLFWMLKK